MYPNNHTHIPSNGNSPSTIDLAIIKNVKKYSKPIILEDLDSDHMPELLVLNDQKIAENNVKFLNYKKANWLLFRQSLNDNVKINNKMYCKNDIDAAVSTLTKCIRGAIDVAVPNVNAKNRVDSLPKEILDMIAQRNKVRRQY